MRRRHGTIAMLTGTACLFLCAATRAQSAKQKAIADQEYVVNLTLQRKPEFAEAVRRWKKFLTDHPRDARIDRVHHHLGTCQLGLKKYADAAATFRKLISKYPRFKSLDAARFNMGLAKYYQAAQSKKPAEFRNAAKAFGEVMTRHAKSTHAPTAAYYRAECLYQSGSATLAIAAYRDFLSRYKKSELLPDVYYALGTAQQEAGSHTKAARTFEEFTRKFPRHALADECKLRFASCRLELGKRREAERVFWSLAMKKEFTFADFALLQIARCRREEKDPKGVARYLTLLLNKHPKSAYRSQALTELGQSLFETKQFKQAEKPLRDAVALKSDDSPTAAYWLAKTLIELKKPADAVSVLDAALRTYPKSINRPLLEVTRLDALYAQPSKRQATVAAYAAFASKHPKHDLAAHAQYMAGFAALAVGDNKQAADHSATFLSNSNWAKHDLRPEVLFVAAESRLLTDPPNISEAEKHYASLIREFPKHASTPRARVRLGYCKLEAKKHTEALRYLRKAYPDLQAKELKAEALLLTGRAFALTNRGSDAISSYESALRVAPNWPRRDELLLRLAIELRLQKKPTDATRHLKTLLAKFPKGDLRDDALFELGRIAESKTQLDAAVAHYREVVSKHAKSNAAPGAAYGIGRVLTAKGDHQSAVQAFDKLIAEFGNDPLAKRARYDRALAYHRLKQHQKALDDLESFLKSKPSKALTFDARYAAALCQVALKKPKEAIANLEYILVNKSDYERADAVYYELAHAHRAAKDAKEALKTFERLVEKHPTSDYAGEAWFHIGQAHREAKDWKKAETAFAAGLNVAKQSEWREALRHETGYTQYRAGNYTAAAETFQRQLKDHPKGRRAADGVYFAGECLFKLGKFSEAAPLFEKSVQQKPARYYDRALYRAAACAARLKQWSSSQKHYETLIAKYPKFDRLTDARYGLGMAFQMQNDLKRARAEYEKVLAATKGKNSRPRAQALFMLGECDFREKKYQAAIVRFTEATVYPDDELRAQCHYESGRCSIELKKPDDALKSLKIVVAKYPKSPEAKLAAQLIATLKKN